MPIDCKHELQPLNKEDFGRISFELFADVLAIRQKLGRFFDEKHYKRALALRRLDVVLEVLIEVSHQSFKKTYFLDVLLANGAIIEFKASTSLALRHKAQLLHYLMLTNLCHGMLINIRPERMTKEFVNNALSHHDRMQFQVTTEQWQPAITGAAHFQQLLSSLLNDWGTCLDLALYEEAITHFLGGEAAVVRPAKVTLDTHHLGFQNLRFVSERSAFKLTAFNSIKSQRQFATHAQQLVNHTDIECLLWANIAHHQVTFRCLTPSSR